jgi:hypothetical protein
LLGRAVWDSAKAKAAAKGKIAPKIFRENLGVRDLSVDRLSFDDAPVVLCHFHDRARQPQVFRGWAVLTCAAASSMGRSVIAQKLPGNDWHANIRLPAHFDGDEMEDQIAHSLNLANQATWRAR